MAFDRNTVFLTSFLSDFEWHDTSPTCQLAEALLEYAAAFAD